MIALLRARFARGEIDAEAFEQARQTLGATRPRGGRTRTPAGAGWSFGGMMGP